MSRQQSAIDAEVACTVFSFHDAISRQLDVRQWMITSIIVARCALCIVHRLSHAQLLLGTTCSCRLITATQNRRKCTRWRPTLMCGTSSAWLRHQLHNGHHQWTRRQTE